MRYQSAESRPITRFAEPAPVNQFGHQNKLCMPLTLSHPAAIIPLARQGLVFSALVVDSISPDFLYFINLSPRGQFGHTLPGFVDLVLFAIAGNYVGRI